MRTIAEILAYNRYNAKRLNSKIFDENDHMIAAVRSKAMEIAQAFLEYAQVGNLNIADIRLVGSNAGYNYSPDSDFDLHIITDLSIIANPESIARLYMDSVKSGFNNSYDIKIKGMDVEIYVEDINTTAMSAGIYSLVKDEWVRFPEPQNEPTDAQYNDAEILEDQLLSRINMSHTEEELASILNDIYLIRKDSLARDGECGAGNLAFKSLRNKGILDNIKQQIKELQSQELSLESKEQGGDS